MDSSVKELQSALVSLCMDSTDRRKTHLLETCDYLAEHLKNKNGELAYAWQATGDFYTSIMDEITNLLSDVCEDVNKFVEKAYEAEVKEKTAVEKANGLSKDILSRLNLLKKD